MRIRNETTFEAPIREQVHRIMPVASINSGTEISVANLERLRLGNTAPVTVTLFKYGSGGQTIKLLGDGNTTIEHNANIKTNTGANKLLAVDKVYTFTTFDGIVFVEDE